MSAVVISISDNLPFSFSLTLLGGKSAAVKGHADNGSSTGHHRAPPIHRCGYVAAFLEIDFTNEPFVWVENKSNQQIAFIERTLQLAINRPANQHVNFTVLPEYSVPGIDGIAAIERILADNQWPLNAVVIAGVDGLNKAQYAGLFDSEIRSRECFLNL